MTPKHPNLHMLFWNYSVCCTKRPASPACTADSAFKIIPYLTEEFPDLTTHSVKNQNHLIQSVIQEKPDLIAIHLGCDAVPPLDRAGYRELRRHYPADKMVIALGNEKVKPYFTGFTQFEYIIKPRAGDFQRFFERTAELLRERQTKA